MKNKNYFAIIIALVLAFALPAALAADTRMETVEYKGFGVIKVEYSRNADWYPDAVFTLRDDAGFEVFLTIIAGEEDDAYLYAPDMLNNEAYSLQFVLGSTDQTVNFSAVTGTEYRINKNNEVNAKVDKEKCDFCRQSGHDEDFCPERVNPGDIPSDPASIAWYFDIDAFCERCDGIGHDDDRCPNR